MRLELRHADKAGQVLGGWPSPVTDEEAAETYTKY